MHNNKVNLDQNPTPSGSMTKDEINDATSLGLSNEVTNASGNTSTTALTPETIEKIMKDGNANNAATTIKLADGTVITRATAGQPGVVVDETPADQDIKPVIIQELKVLQRPRQGTDDGFVFEFDAEIKDEGILQNIEIIRKDF